MKKNLSPDQEQQAEEMHRDMLDMLDMLEESKKLPYNLRRRLMLTDLTERVDELCESGVTANGSGFDEVRALMQSARRGLEGLLAEIANQDI